MTGGGRGMKRLDEGEVGRTSGGGQRVRARPAFFGTSARDRNSSGRGGLRMVASNYDETLTLRINGKPVQLGRGAAAKVWVNLAAK